MTTSGECGFTQPLGWVERVLTNPLHLLLSVPQDEVADEICSEAEPRGEHLVPGPADDDAVEAEDDPRAVGVRLPVPEVRRSHRIRDLRQRNKGRTQVQDM